MKKRLPANVRFVKCPKCSEVLPEPSDVPIYMCGGCDTILQAKYYIKESSNDFDQGGESSGSSPQSILSAQHSPDPSREDQNGYLDQAELPDSRRASSSNGHCIADTQDSSSHGQIEEDKRYGEQCIDGEYPLRSDVDSLKKHEEVSEPVPNFGVGRGEKLSEEQPGARSCSKETSELDASSSVPLSNYKVSPIETQDSSSNLANDDGKIKEEKQCVYGEDPLSSDASSLGKYEKASEPAPNIEDVRRDEKLSEKQPGARSCSKETSETDASSTLPLSNDKVSPIKAQDSSSNFTNEYGKMKEEKQCVYGEDPLSSDVKSLGKHEKTLEPSPNIEDVGRGEKLSEEEPGTRSCSRGTASDELCTVAFSNEEVSSTGDVEPEREQNGAAKHGFEQLGPDTYEREVSSPHESCVPESNKSLPLATTVYQGEVDIAAKSLNFQVSTSLKKSTLPQCKEVPGLPLENQERVKRIGIQGVNLDPSTLSDELSSHENKDFSETVVENYEIDIEIDIEQTQCRPTETKDEEFDGNNRTEFISSTVSSHERDESPCVASGEENHSEGGRNQNQVADDARKLMNNMSITVLSTNRDRNEKDAAPEPLEANAITSKTHTVPLPSSNTLMENEKLSKVDFIEVSVSRTKLSEDFGDASRPNIWGFNQKTVPSGLDSATSTKKLESPDIVNVKADVINSPNFFPRSPTRNSLAYDGSVSSYDGNDDQTLQMDTEILEQISEVKDQVTAKSERRDHFSAIPPDHQNEGGSSIQHNMPRSMFNNSQNLEGDRRASVFRRNRMRHRTEGYLPSGYSSYLMSSEMAYESSVSSNLMHDEFHSHSNYHLPPHYSRGMESRTMRRHLHGSNVEGRMLSNSSWVREGVSHPYCESACEMYPPPRYPRYHYAELRKTEAQLPFSSNVCMPYSGEVLRSGYQQLYDPYLHRHPTSETRWSSHLPSPRSYCSRGWNSLRSGKPLEFYPTSPQFIDSDSYRPGYNSFSDDAGQNDQMVMNRLERRKKQPSRQRHFRPVAGGAPFVTCYECSALLQLPSEFLLFESRRIHRLKCTSCSNILKFHLEKGIHLVPYTQRASATPDNEANEGEISRSLYLGSTSQQTNNNNRETPQRRASSMNRSGVQDAAEGPLRNFSGVHERQRSKLEGQNSQNKGKRAMVESGSGASTSSANNKPTMMKVSWEEPDARTSPLHRLMGYSTPSQVFYSKSNSSQNLQVPQQSRR